MTGHGDLLAQPTLLPADPGAADLTGGSPPAEVASRYPASMEAWGRLAVAALTQGRSIDAYAYARTGYHRGLDALRRNGWRGSGPVPWSHEGNQGFLRSLWALGRAAGALGEDEEAARCAQFLDDCDPAARAAVEAYGDY
jgi:hypothetical protein